MTLGLPGHLARESSSRALANAGHWAAFACLGIAAILGIVMATIGGETRSWPAVALVGIMVVLLAFVVRFPSVTLTVAYLVVGTGVVCVLTVLVMEPGSVFTTTNNSVLALPRIALILVGGAGSGSVIAVVWATLGFGLGEAAMFLGVALVGGTYAPSTATTLAFALVVIARVFDGVTRRPDMRRETGLHRASQQTRELAIRHDIELRATARLHDTALSHLVAIAAAGSGPVDERLRLGIRQDLGLIVGRDWASDHAAEAVTRPATGAPRGRRSRGDGRPPWGGRSTQATDAVRADSSRRIDGTTPDDEAPSLTNAFSAAANAGLEVRVTGDVAVLGTLGPARAAALDAAVAQCLINVARHAGVDQAELAIGLGGGEVTVAVMDSGAGFDEREVPPDRIGLRTSIRARIEQERGTVRLWSTKGIGTTIVLTVPEGGE
ncbi:sensor histidine kinase [Agromyces subbeticus]|uniref:sensor histidine kinase n=1 Tax=Agromyces subbeticus TaxID=293890 RepID=UPI0003B79BEC|nr:ATP-binding protein [Agromyces subbeticus]